MPKISHAQRETRRQQILDAALRCFSRDGFHNTTTADIVRESGVSQDELERKLYVVRKRAENEIAASSIQDKHFFYIPSLSTRTIIYKGLLLAGQITHVYRELTDTETMSARCLVHARSSEKTFPTLAAAHRDGVGALGRRPVPTHLHHSDHLRNHVSRALNLNRIANLDTQPANFILVMQRRFRHHHAADIDGF